MIVLVFVFNFPPPPPPPRRPPPAVTRPADQAHPRAEAHGYPTDPRWHAGAAAG